MMFGDFEYSDLEFVSSFVLLISNLNISTLGSMTGKNIIIPKTAKD
jgi:hypothetical protein